MKRGFYTIMSAQFCSSLADNALFVVAVELLRTSGAAEWQRAALVPMFALFYVLLAPFVGAFADALPKGRVMLISNAIKVLGCLMMLTGWHPLLAYAVVGLGAAAYSPAKYGILTELLPASQLVKANGWIEGLTIASIILGVLLGGQLVAPHLAQPLLALGLPGITLAAEAAIVAMNIFIFIFELQRSSVCDTRRYRENNFSYFFGIILHVFGNFRPWPNKAHFTYKDIDQLRQFIQFSLPKKSSRSSYPFIIACGQL